MKKLLLSLVIIPMLSSAKDCERPPIIGVAHAAIYCENINKTRSFLKEYFGFDESIEYKNTDGSTRLSAIKINERQIIELFPEKESGSDRLLHYAIETTDAEGMRQYLKTKGYNVPDKVNKLDMGIINFNMTDPTGHTLEFLQFTGDGDFGKTRGMYMPNTRIANRMNHLGFYVPNAKVAEDFFCDALGFNIEWKMVSESGNVRVMLLRVPEGEDAIELLMSETTPTFKDLLFDNHVSLEVINLSDALNRLSSRKFPDYVQAPGKPSVMKNGKSVINFALPDGTRLELME